MNWIKQHIKDIGLYTSLVLLVGAITWIVNLNRDIADLKQQKLSEKETRFLIQQEVSEMKSDVRDIKNWIMNKSK
jgi:regulatory protein YycH of two-component signal transduction system YycFG